MERINNGPNRPESKTTRIFQPVRQVAAPGRSMPSTAAPCINWYCSEIVFTLKTSKQEERR